KEIKNPDYHWEDETDILVVGGGSAGEFLEAVGEDQGAPRIKQFVEDGGTYLGICSAAYLGASMIKFRGAEMIKERPGLGFFNGIARGGLDDLMGRSYTGKSDSATIIDLLHSDMQTTYPALYWGGPRFLLSEANKNIQPLSWYSAPDTDESYLMSLKAQVGDKGGRAFLIGTHIEISHRNIEKYVYEGDIPLQNQQNSNIAQGTQKYKAADFDKGFELLLKEMGLKQALTRRSRPESSLRPTL
ncbi:MAG: BPL-N domain-containing protein, partial [Alphaproteobacteria bacterium]|nr:BPL-N domain-containing protein [Alphaproteobacteria bacterium]